MGLPVAWSSDVEALSGKASSVFFKVPPNKRVLWTNRTCPYKKRSGLHLMRHGEMIPADGRAAGWRFRVGVALPRCSLCSSLLHKLVKHSYVTCQLALSICNLKNFDLQRVRSPPRYCITKKTSSSHSLRIFTQFEKICEPFPIPSALAWERRRDFLQHQTTGRAIRPLNHCTHVHLLGK
jgi:hypothetical protein